MSSAYQTTILFVDDEPFVIEALRRIFEGDQYRSIFVTSGKEALEILEKTDVQVVVSDFRMPGMSGGELLGLVSNKWPDTVRIILSGFVDMSSVVTAINEGHIFKFVSKPWRNEELRAIVREGVEKYWQQIELHSLAEFALAQNENLLNEHLEGIKRLNDRHAVLEDHVGSLEAYRLAFLSMDTPAVLFRGASCFDANDAARLYLGVEQEGGELLPDHPVVQQLARHLADHAIENLPQASELTIPLKNGRVLPVELLAECGLERRVYAVARLGREM